MLQQILSSFMGPKFPVRHFLFVGHPLLLYFAAFNFHLPNCYTALYCLPFRLTLGWLIVVTNPRAMYLCNEQTV